MQNKGGRILGLDYGDKTIGVAVSDPSEKVALGLETVRREIPEAIKPSMKRIGELIEEYSAYAIVLGYPTHLDGNPSKRSELTVHFKKKLEQRFNNIPVYLFDERLSTIAVTRVFEGERGASRRLAKQVDEMAAVYILQGYLDKKNNEGT